MKDIKTAKVQGTPNSVNTKRFLTKQTYQT